MQPTINLLLPALLFGAIGIVIGAVVVLVIVDRTRGKSEQKDSQAAADVPTEPKSELPADRFPTVARLVREHTSGRLAVEVEDKLYLTSYSMPGQIRETLDTVAEELIVWLGKQASPTPQPTRSEPAAPVPPFINSEPARVVATTEPPRSTSIVSQINEILQEMLEVSSLSERKISITQEPSMGVMVWVDGIKYPGVDSVPENEVKNLIKSAVMKWEKKNDPANRYP